MSTRAPLALGIALAALTLAAGPVRAQVPLRVRAETRLELRIEDRGGELALLGTLRDDLGTPLGEQPVVVVLEGGAQKHERASVRTDAAGTFELRVDAPPGEALVRAEFAGDAYHDGTEAARVVHPGVEDVRLALTLPRGGVFDLDLRSHPLTIVARADSGPAPVRIELLDELGRRLGEGVANDLGRLRLELTASLLGPPGAGRLVARSLADARYAASQTEVPIIRMRPTHIALRASPAEARPDARIHLEGRLFGADGARRRAAVGLYLDGRHVTTVLTDDHGDFEGEAILPATDATGVAFSAKYQPNDPGHGASVSPAAIVRVRAPSPHRWALRLAPPLVLLLLWAAARSGRVRFGGLSPRGRSAKALAPRVDRAFGPRVRALRGLVLGESDAPIAGAHLRFVHPDRPLPSLTTDAEGRFAAADLPRGEIEISASAPGYAETIVRRALPVRPRDAEIVFRLTSLRAVALDAYKAAAEHWLDSPEAWLTTTNAQAAAQAPRNDRHEATALAADVDRVYYGPSLADPSDVDRIVRSAEEQRNNAEPLHRTR